MSDSQKQQRPGATPIKNPLLSASVTGLTFDDFPNKPLLLPAAPPIVHAAVPAPVVTPTGLLTREHKSLVTVGSSSLDTENLDEINLNASNEENQTSDITDPNANPLLEQSNQNVNSDSILSQAASSFSALPSVASNVFSTFSKRINAISSRETTPNFDQQQQDLNANNLAPQLDIQPTYTQQQQQLPQQSNFSQAASPPFYAPTQGGNYFSGLSDTSTQQDIQTNLPPPEPPKFYTPSEVPAIPSVNTAPTTNSAGQNNFRFSSKKKLYAPIPGLSDVNPKPTTTLDPLSVNAPISYDPLSGNNFYQQTAYSATEEQKSEERKVGSGIFSKITNLAPAGVLQNITGFVQSAAGSLAQNINSDSQQTFPEPSSFQEENNYFTGQPPPPPTNYFVPPSFSAQQTSSESITYQNPQSSYASNQQTQPTPFTSQPINFFNPQQVSQEASETLSQPSIHPVTLTESSQTNIPLFSTSNLPQKLNSNHSPQPLPPSRPPSRPPSSAPNLQSNSNEQSAVTLFNTNNQTLSTASPVSFFDPTKYLSPNPNSISQTNLGNLPLPPTTDPKVPPPSSGHTSYRLQKGTKLYKNPLTPQETAPIHVTPNQIQIQNQFAPTYPSPTNFVTPQSVSLFAPSIAGELRSNTDESIQNVPLFAPSSTTVQSVPLFAPVEEQSKSNEQQQNIALFSPSQGEQNILSFEQQVDNFKTENLVAPPTKKVKSNNHEQTVAQFSDPTDATKLDELKSDNKFETEVPKQDTNSQSLDNKEIHASVEPIEIDEPNSEVQNNTIEDNIEQTLKKLSLNTETSSEPVKLPPISSFVTFSNNPYRRGSTTEPSKQLTTQPILANFFTPEPSSDSDNLNFFATLPVTEPGIDKSSSEVNFFSQTAPHKQPETTNFFNTSNNQSEDRGNNLGITPVLKPLEPNTAVHPPISAFFPSLPTSFGLVPAIREDENNISKHLNESTAQGNVPNVPPPIGFESFSQLAPSAPPAVPENTVTVREEIQTNIVQQEATSQTQQPEIVNRFSNYFNQTNHQTESTKNPSSFFDSFSASQQQQSQQQQIEITPPSVATNEEQRIQYFFNNPPPKEASTVGDLNYDLVHSGLGIKNLQQRSLTPISNLVEPPSSACSEFSEISNSTAGQKSIAANLSITENREKSNEKEEEEENKSIENSIILEQDPVESDVNSISNIIHYEELPEEVLKELRMANIISADKSNTSPVANVSYKPAVKHWFFKRTIGDKQLWVPFSHYDSALLETSLLMEGDDKPNIVAVEGGRYDVNISERKKMSVYWESEPIEVRRCSWFYKAIDSKYVPYEEQTAEVLENEYKQAAESGVWHKTIILGMGEQVVFHGPTVIVHFQQQQNTDAWGGTTQTSTRPRVVKRDLDDFNIEQGESQKVDHLLFMVHGIGSACDLKLRSVEEVVEDFRTIARQLVQSHYKNSTDLGLVGRVEVLPISWHSHLHSVEVGIDEKLRMITLESIPKLRNFTNDTLLDILFYTSPTFCQKIMNTIAQSLNSLYLKYRERHPEFNGGVSLAGHSLGSLILFDLLCHQHPIKESEEKNLENPDQFVTTNTSSTQLDSNQLEDKQISYTMGPAGTGQPFINYDQLIFQPKKFFALGSPIGVFVTVRGIDKLGLDFRLPTCPGFYNIFHPYDPVAYRIEALVNPDLSGIRPVLIPHHKGRKRMHLELKETMARVSMDLKNRFLDKFKTTLDSVNIFGSTSKSTKEAEELMEKEVDKVIQMQIQMEEQNQNQNKNSQEKLSSDVDTQNEAPSTSRQRTDSVSTAMSDDVVEIDFPLGKLNDSKRIDYVLQEAPLEFINEYIFALSSHVCYWDSEDTILFVMKEIYAGLGISPDSQVPQQSMTIERPSSLFLFL